MYVPKVLVMQLAACASAVAVARVAVGWISDAYSFMPMAQAVSVSTAGVSGFTCIGLTHRVCHCEKIDRGNDDPFAGTVGRVNVISCIQQTDDEHACQEDKPAVDC